MGLLKRIGSRIELNDLIWEMQGELQSSHAYVIGGDIKESSKQLPQFYLGAEFKYYNKNNLYAIQHSISGDIWINNHHSPLISPVINIEEGDYIHNIDGIKLNKNTNLNALLSNKSSPFIKIEFSKKKDTSNKTH